MKVLITGPSGAGKTYVSGQLKELGYPVWDSDDIEGLSGWYDGQGNQVSYPPDAGQEFFENHRFLWNRNFLQEFLTIHPDIYIFGMAGNAFEMLDLFDKVYFLKVPPKIQMERLLHPLRANPMGQTEYQRKNAVWWAQIIERDAKKLEIPMIDATKKPQEIWEIISQ